MSKEKRAQAVNHQLCPNKATFRTTFACRVLIAYNEIDEEINKHPSLRAQRRLLSANLTAQNSC